MRPRTRWQALLRLCAVLGPCLAMSFALTGPARAFVYDDFNDNTICPYRWDLVGQSYGTLISETNQRMEITLPADAAGDFIGAYCSSACTLRGDFDVQVDYELLTWPSGSGVRVGMRLDPAFWTPPGVAGVSRVGFGNTTLDFPGWSREVHLVGFDGVINGAIPTADLSGKLRLVRSGSTMTGYCFSSGAWVPLDASTATFTGPLHFILQVWSHDPYFCDQTVKAAFDNLIINQGQLECPYVPPQADAGPDQTVEAVSPAGASVQLDGSGSSSAGGGALTYAWDIDGDGEYDDATGATPTVGLGLGTHTISLQVTDDSGLSDTDEVVIDVVDTTPPSLELSMLRATLWPPNHKLVLVARVSGVADACDPAPAVAIDVQANEPINGPGDGNTEGDWVVVDNGGTWDIWVRSERAGNGSGREYYITATATDAEGNWVRRTATITVPPDRRSR